MANRCGLLLLLVFSLLAAGNCDKCEKGAIRLEDGPNETEGRLEVCQNGEWGTVCDYGFRYSEAQTVCHQLGFTGANYNKCCLGKYGPGTGAIIEGLSCDQYVHKNVSDCDQNELDIDYCDHSADVGVRCLDSRPPDCSYGDIKLVGGPNKYEGRVEVCDYNKHYGTVCNAIFGEEEAQVVCRQLGFPVKGAQAIYDAPELYGDSTRSMFMDDPDCRGTESSLLYCNSYMSSFGSCTFKTYAGVKCQADTKAKGEPSTPKYRHRTNKQRRFRQFK